MVNATLDGQKSGQALQTKDPGTTVKLSDVTVQNCSERRVWYLFNKLIKNAMSWSGQGAGQGAAIHASNGAVLEAMRSKFKKNGAVVSKANW